MIRGIFGTFVGICQLKATEFLVIGADDLNADRQPLIVEARRSRERRASGHRDEKRGLHPLVVGLHFPARDFLRPMLTDVEGKYLCGRYHEEIITFEESMYGVGPVGAHG